MIEKEIYNKLSASFPMEAYQVDSSRGFDLSSIKAQYIVERLNEVLGISGWDLQGNFEKIKDDIIFHGKLIIRFKNDKDEVIILEHCGIGYCGSKKNLGDQYKSAKTDCLSKTASLFGIGNECFKGLIDPKSIKKGKTNNIIENIKKDIINEEIPTFSKKKKQLENKEGEDKELIKDIEKW